jgi:hypothetical protein
MTGLRPVPRLHVESNSNLLVRCQHCFCFSVSAIPPLGYPAFVRG